MAGIHVYKVMCGSLAGGMWTVKEGARGQSFKNRMLHDKSRNMLISVLFSHFFHFLILLVPCDPHFTCYYRPVSN